jgi:general secretion pathway protein J
LARGGRDIDGGFALVEALVSLVIVAMISLLMIEGVTTGRRVWERIAASSANGEAIDAAQATLRDRVEQIFPATLEDRTPPSIDFDGGSQALTFLSSPAQFERPAPLRRYRLALTAGGDLVLSSTSDVASPADGVVSRQTLLRGVRAVDLAYFGAADPDLIRHWRQAWVGQPEPPELIRLRLAFEPGDRRQWPDLIIRPRVTVDTGCKFNPVNPGCGSRP